MNRLLILLLIAVGSIFLTCNSVKEVTNQNMHSDVRWATVDSLEGKGLYRSAWAKTLEIREAAERRGDYQTQYKALCYQLKYAKRVEDGSELDAIVKLSEVAENTTMPLSAIAHSMTAEAYWTYYQQHQWEIIQRTPAPGVEDIRYWDISRFTDEIDLHFHQSLRKPSKLKSIKLSELAEELVLNMENQNLRPSLYEMLAYRAMDFYQNRNSGLTRPKDFFQVDELWFYAPGMEFANHDLSKTDTLSFTYRAIDIYQDLLAHQEEGTAAWLSTDLKRLKFVSQESNLSDKKEEVKDVHLLNALEHGIAEYGDGALLSEYAYEKALLYYQSATSYQEGADADKKEHYLKAENICEGLISKQENTRGAEMAKNLLVDIRQKTLMLGVEEVLIPERATLVKVDYRNLGKLWLKVVSVPHDFMADERYDEEKYIRQLCKQPMVESWELSLPESEDHQSHSIETMMPGLPSGHYAVIAGTDEDFKSVTAKAYANFWVTHIALNEGTHPSGGSIVHLINRDSGKDITGAHLIHYFLEYERGFLKHRKKEQARYTSPANGEVHIPFIQDQFRQVLEVNWNGEFYQTNFYARHPFREGNNHKSTQYFLDRSIYRPGQTLYFKGIHIDQGPDGPSIAANENIELTLRDANYQEVSKLNLRSNEFGSFSGTFTLPSSGLTGQMTLQSQHGSTTFSVEEYKRPKFKVEMDPIEGVYKLGDNVRVTGTAMAYNGAPVADAEVRYTVERLPVWIWKYWGWWGRPPMHDQSSVQMKVGNGKTDKKGEFEFDFEALKGNENGGEDFSHYNFSIKLEVVDINGETREGVTSLNIGDKGLRISSDIPAELNKDKLPEIKIKSENLNGQEVMASGQWELRFVPAPDEVKVKRRWSFPEFLSVTEEEFQTELPLFRSGRPEADPENEGELITSGEWNTANTGIWNPSVLEGQPNGRYVLKLKSGGPEEVTWSTSFFLYQQAEGPSVFSEALKVITVNSPYLPGDVAEVLISSAWDDVHVQLELEHDKKIIRVEDINLDKEQKILRVPIKKEHQEGLFLHISGLRHNRTMKESIRIDVTPIDRILNVNLETYRDKMLPGSKEEWRVRVDAENGDEVISELLLSMYDASLDQFKMHSWSFDPWRNSGPMLGKDFKGFGRGSSRLYAPDWHHQRSYVQPRGFPSLNRYGYHLSFYGRGEVYESMAIGGVRRKLNMMSTMEEPMAMSADGDMANMDAVTITEQSEGQDDGNMVLPTAMEKPGEGSAGPQIRSNFQETAFFFPDLKTDANGDLIFSFTMPESLTTWKFQALGHSKDLQTGTTITEVITQKNLMVVPNAPRFLREGDRISLSTKLVSLSAETENGNIRLELLDAISMKDISDELIQSSQSLSFSIQGKESKAFDWEVTVPEDYSAITYRFIAEGQKHSDGEEDALPVLSNRMLVTEAMPFAITKEDKKEFDFTRMAEANSSSTMKPHALTLEFTANPIWYAVQAMPYMMEYPHDCSEQVFTRFYANTLAENIISERPKLRAIINTWKDLSPDAFLSNLEKNQELKYVILEETPWVMEAKDETERKKRLSLLLDVNHMADRQKRALDKLIQNQDPSGGWPWFPGMRPSLYITQYIVSGLGHLKHLGILDESDPKLNQMISEAIRYMDEEHLKRYKRMKRHASDLNESNHTGPFEIQYLYARSFYKEQGLPQNEAFKYYKKQAAEFWLNRSVYLQGMSALALDRLDNAPVAKDIMRSVKEQAMMDDDLGMYWKDQRNGWYWYEAGIERHALMVEAFSEIMSDEDAVYGLKQWLIFNKQTNDWETTRATAEACYALLLGGSDWTQDRAWSIQVGNEKYSSSDLALKTEAGTGYMKRRWDGDEIKPGMSKVEVQKKGEAPAWGALYYQYFEQLDKITSSESPLEVRKQVFKVLRTDADEEMVELNDGASLKVGDRVRVRMEIETDREMEYVHIKDMRSSGTEPVDVMSGMVYSGGLGFYKNTRDAATNFFIDDLRKGAYVLEYDVFVSHKGDFSNGITTIQCMYAPEFTAHSEGIRVVVE